MVCGWELGGAPGWELSGGISVASAVWVPPWVNWFVPASCGLVEKNGVEVPEVIRWDNSLLVALLGKLPPFAVGKLLPTVPTSCVALDGNW